MNFENLKVTWAKINQDGFVVEPSSPGIWQRLAIISHSKNNLSALLISNAYTLGIKITPQILELYHIDPSFKGLKMTLIHPDDLKYDGKICSLCNQFFEYLRPSELFHCWKCDV